MSREYIINFKFGTWRNQLWFSGNDDNAFMLAQSTLDDVVKTCRNSNEFFTEAVKHFETYGFYHIKR